MKVLEQIRLLTGDYLITQDLPTRDWIIRVKDQAVRNIQLEANATITDLIVEVKLDKDGE